MPNTSPVVLDYGNMLSSRLGKGRGVDPARLEGLAERFREIHADAERRRASGELGFFALPDAHEVVNQIDAFANGAGQVFQNVVVLGIGGSALGTIAMRTALLNPYWNEMDLDALRGVRVLVLNALWYGKPHPTHFTVEEAVEVAREIGAAHTFLTHLSHRVRHAELEADLPAGIAPAYDGLVVEV